MVEINTLTMLQVGTVLHGTYRIESYLSSGGFGNTYVAKNIEFDETYAIKEFFVKGVCQRDGNSTTISVSNSENSDSFAQQKEKFKKEARRLRSLSNPHIVKVYDLFEENGTAYYVMDYVDGENLSTRLNRTHSPLSESEVRNYLSQILDGLESIHAAGIWHLDIKPANIMVDKHDVVKLIDFGASKQQSTAGGATASTGISYTNGYAPSEQMAQSFDKFGPWTDFYALGATLYKLLTNQNPPLVTDLSEDESEDKHIALPMPNVSNDMKKLVVWMMQVNRLKRPKNVGEIKQFLGLIFNIEQTSCTKKVFSMRTTEEENVQTIYVTKESGKTADFEKSNPKNKWHKCKIFIGILGSVIGMFAIYIIYVKTQRDAIIDGIISNMVEINYGGMSFSINKFEVTQREYEAVMGNTFSYPSKSSVSYFKGAFLPMESLDRNSCLKFIQKLNKMTGHNFRLPTLREWKCAAKAGGNTEYSGSNNLDDVAWWKGNSENKTHIVGTKHPNNWGLYDMDGNVSEKLQDHKAIGISYDGGSDEVGGLDVILDGGIRDEGFRLAE